MSTKSNLFATTHIHLPNLNRKGALMRVDIFQDLHHAAEFMRLMFHSLTSSFPASCVYDESSALHCAASSSSSSSTIHRVPAVMSYMPAWVMWNGPHWCNRFNYSTRCSNWILTRRLIHKLSKRYFARKRTGGKKINMCHLYLDRLTPCLPYAAFPNESILPRFSNPKSNLRVRPFLDPAPPRWALTCRIIQGGINSNGPAQAHARSRYGNLFFFLLAELEKPSRAAAAEKRRGSKRNKEIQLGARGPERSHDPGTEQRHEDTLERFTPA